MITLSIIETIGHLLLAIEPLLTTSVMVLKDSYEYNHNKAAMYDYHVKKDLTSKHKGVDFVNNQMIINESLYYPVLAEDCIEPSSSKQLEGVDEDSQYVQTILGETEENLLLDLIGNVDTSDLESNEEYLDFNEFSNAHSFGEGIIQSAKPMKESIDDYILGVQLWTVEVVGYEQDYLHVSDGSSRTWLHLCNHNVVIGDILSLEVDRKTHEDVEVISVELLQTTSIDYMTVDQLEHFEEYQQAI